MYFIIEIVLSSHNPLLPLHSSSLALSSLHNIPTNRFISKANIKDERGERQVVRGFSTVPGISLINVEGTGMMGVPGIANRIFGALKEVQVSKRKQERKRRRGRRGEENEIMTNSQTHITNTKMFFLFFVFIISLISPLL